MPKYFIMLRFKQFLLEAPSVEDQLKTLNRAVANAEKAGVPEKGSPFPKVTVNNVIGSGEYPQDVQVVGNPGEHWEIPGVRGEYHPEDQTVVVYNTNNPASNPDTLTHEFAHAGHDTRQIAQGRKAAGEGLRSRSRGIDPEKNYQGPAGADQARPLAYPEYSYTDIEVNARAVTNAKKAAERYQAEFNEGMKTIDKNDAQAVQNLRNKLRASILDDVMGNERQISSHNVNTTLNADGLSSEARARAMQKVIDAGQKAERATQEKVARAIAMAERGEYPSIGTTSPIKPTTLVGNAVNSVVNELDKPATGILGGLAAGVGSVLGDMAAHEVKSTKDWEDTMSGLEQSTKDEMKDMSPEEQDEYIKRLDRQNAVATGIDYAVNPAKVIPHVLAAQDSLAKSLKDSGFNDKDILKMVYNRGSKL